jgi:hypothetical protein
MRLRLWASTPDDIALLRSRRLFHRHGKRLRRPVATSHRHHVATAGTPFQRGSGERSSTLNLANPFQN